MITDKDVTKLKQTFVTKDEFGKLKTKVDSIDQKLDKLLKQTDTNAGALKSIQEELAIKTYRADQIEDHEERITKLEKHAGFSSS